MICSVPGALVESAAAALVPAAVHVVLFGWQASSVLRWLVLVRTLLLARVGEVLLAA